MSLNGEPLHNVSIIRSTTNVAFSFGVVAQLCASPPLAVPSSATQFLFASEFFFPTYSPSPARQEQFLSAAAVISTNVQVLYNVIIPIKDNLINSFSLAHITELKLAKTQV